METNKETVYDVDYFIEKFSAIPEDKWCTGYFEMNNKHCALGHCGVRPEDIDEKDSSINNAEGKALANLLRPISNRKTEFEIVYIINDGGDGDFRKQPKQRILDALFAIKESHKKQSELKRTDITQELAILPVDETSDIKQKKAINV